VQVVATGGMSFPKVGTDGTGHRILSQLGHSLHEPYPALTPLTGGHPGDGDNLAGDPPLLSR
jgi:predicted flavoprotein YhiN